MGLKTLDDAVELQLTVDLLIQPPKPYTPNPTSSDLLNFKQYHEPSTPYISKPQPRARSLPEATAASSARGGILLCTFAFPYDDKDSSLPLLGDWRAVVKGKGIAYAWFVAMEEWMPTAIPIQC